MSACLHTRVIPDGVRVVRDKREHGGYVRHFYELGTCRVCGMRLQRRMWIRQCLEWEPKPMEHTEVVATRREAS